MMSFLLAASLAGATQWAGHTFPGAKQSTAAQLYSTKESVCVCSIYYIIMIIIVIIIPARP